MSFLITSAAIGAGSALYGIGKSISQSSQANKIDKNNPRPTYSIPDEYVQNVNMAKQMAQIGLPQQQYNNQLNAINKNQASGVATLNNSANPGSSLAAIVRAGDDATGNLNAQDASARQNNERYLIGQNGVLGQQKLAQQQYNKFDKYSEDYNKAAALRGAGAQNLQNGINGAAGIATDLYNINSLGSSPSTTPSTNYNLPANQEFNSYLNSNPVVSPVNTNYTHNLSVGNNPLNDMIGPYSRYGNNTTPTPPQTYIGKNWGVPY